MNPSNKGLQDEESPPFVYSRALYVLYIPFSNVATPSICCVQPIVKHAARQTASPARHHNITHQIENASQGEDPYFYPVI